MDTTQLLARLPAFQGQWITVTPRQSVGRIMREIVSAHSDFVGDYDRIAEYFISSGPLATMRMLFDFCKDNLAYVVEGTKTQTVRSPTAILVLNEIHGVDCKHYASFIGGVLDAINRTGQEEFDWCYRFASYSLNDKVPEHVFVVVKKDGYETWIDPVLDSFDARLPYPIFIDDVKPKKMALVRISGIAGQGRVGSPAGYRSTNYARSGSAGELSACGCHSIGGRHRGIGATTSQTGAMIEKFSPTLAAIPVVGWVGAAVGVAFGAILNIFGDKFVQGPDIRWLIQLYQYYVLKQANVQSDNMVNEALKLDAWKWFSLVCGVPVFARSFWNCLHDGHEEGKYTGLDAAGRAAVYVRITGNPGKATMAQITSAATIAASFSYKAPAGGWANATIAPDLIDKSGNLAAGQSTSTSILSTNTGPNIMNAGVAPGGGLMDWVRANPGLSAAGIALAAFLIFKK
jgi:hypothetical protein